MTLGERIYRLRNDRNMTQEQLAEKLGVTRQSISKWEGDLVKPEIDKLKAIAKLFEISLDELISDEAGEKTPPETDSGKQHTGQLQSSNGKFKGKVSLPISGDKMKISVVVDNDGEKQKITLDENVYVLDEITALPTINITTGVTRGITYTGSIGVGLHCEDMTLTENIQDIKVIIKNKDKIVFKSAAADFLKSVLVEYSFKCEEADWEKDFKVVVSYYDGNIDKSVEIYGAFDPTNFHSDNQYTTIATEGASYDDNYNIVIK